MKKMYFKHAALALGIVACAGSASAEWQNVNGQYLKDAAFLPGWSGALSQTANGIGEVWCSAFNLYQIMDLPAGEYTLTANAFYRYANNDLSKVNMTDGKNHFAYIFLGDAKTPVEGLFDKTADSYPNNMEEAAAAFEAGRYLNTVKFTHKGGDLKFGITNTGSVWDEWCAFDNFKLQGPSGEITVVNGDFSEGLDAKRSWDNANLDGGVKTPDMNKTGGIWRKTNATIYNVGQQIELPAGKYRFGVQSFLRYGAGNVAGKYLDIKDDANTTKEGESAWDRHVAQTENPAHNAYIYVTDGWDLDVDEVTPVKPVDEDGAKYGNPNSFYKETKIKCIFDEQLETYPENNADNNLRVNETDDWYTRDGFERQAAAVFVNNPDLYRNYVEFDLTTPAKVWVGIKKDANAPQYYWNPFNDFTIEKYVEGGSGVAEIVVDENAPVEYYNLQGIRVANPENGLYIVKQGNKVTKRVIK